MDYSKQAGKTSKKMRKLGKTGKKNKKKFATLVVAKLVMGDNEIKDEQQLKNPESPRRTNPKKEQKLNNPNYFDPQEKHQTKELKKSKRHSLSDDIGNIEDLREEFNQNAFKEETQYIESLKQEALMEIYSPEEANFEDQDQEYDSEEEVILGLGLEQTGQFEQEGEQEQESDGEYDSE